VDLLEASKVVRPYKTDKNINGIVNSLKGAFAAPVAALAAFFSTEELQFAA
jgi:hypothetical protein